MSDAVVVRVDAVRKRYRIGERHRHRTVRETFSEVVAGAFRRRAAPEWIWAVDDVSFEVRQGEVLGVIGRNGSGKSTLLKILARITPPTEGYAEIHGRVGALLEVGTGFHPELTGRENIYLNGAVLGMKKVEIDAKFDEIVAFAETERFLDTPVKRYSSGMYVRLAFAVAAHLEPSILIVDEVLAVGDAAFQRKCLGRMNDVARQGRTVLFVSHNMVAVQDLCSRAIWLHEGRVAAEGEAVAVVSRYLQASLPSLIERTWPDIATAPGNDTVRVRCARVRPAQGAAADSITVRTSLLLEFEYWSLDPRHLLSLSLHVYNEHGIMLFNTFPVESPTWLAAPYPVGLFRDVCHVPGNLLNAGMLQVELLVVRDDAVVIYRHRDILSVQVHDGSDMRRGWYGAWPGAVRPILEWRTELVEPMEVDGDVRR